MPLNNGYYENIFIHQNFNKNEIREVLIHNATVLNRPTPTPSPGSDKGLLYFDVDSNRIIVWDGYQWHPVTYYDDRDFFSNRNIKLQNIWSESRELEGLTEVVAQNPNNYVQYHPDTLLIHATNSWAFTNNTIDSVVFPETFSEGGSIPSFFDPVLKTYQGNTIDRIDNGIEIWRLIEHKNLDDTISWRVIFFNGFPNDVSISNPPELTYYEYIGERLNLSNIGSGTPSNTITVEDYNTGATFSNISTLIFRGNTLTTPLGTSSGVLAKEGSTSERIVVWIPAPRYVDYFNQEGNVIPDLATASRYISNGNGSFNQGNYDADTQNVTFNYTLDGILNYSVVDFAAFDNTSGNLELSLFDDDGISLINIITYSLTGTGSTTSNGLTISVTDFTPDNDRYKVTSDFIIDLNNINLRGIGATQNGGKYSVRIEHNNTNDPLYTSVPKIQTAFYDYDTINGSDSTATINGTPSLIENLAVIKYASGVAYYDNSSSFTVSISDIDFLNDQTYPTDYQLRVDFDATLGITDVTRIRTDFNGWTSSWNVQDLSYSSTHSIVSTNLTHPTLDTNNNLGVSTNQIIAYIKDWVEVDNIISPNFDNLIWIKTTVNDRNTEDFQNELFRLDVNTLINSSATASYGSTVSLSSNTYELQQIFGRLVYPKLDFSSYFPQYNITNSIDYSSLGTQSITIDVVDNMTLYTDVSRTYNDYRWYLRQFNTGSPGTTVGNGIFDFNTDFVESDLETQNDDTGTSTGNSNFLLFMGLTNNTVPTQWFDLSKTTTNGEYEGPRANPTGGGSSNLDDNGEIAWNTGTVQGWTIFLLVGINSNATTNEIQQIDINI